MTEAGIKGLLVTFDSFDDVVAGEMVEIIKGILKNPWEGHHNYRESLTDVDAFLRVHEWYAGGNSHQAFKESIKADYDSLVNLVFPPVNKEALDMNVTEFREMPDGSARVEYEVNDKMKEFLMGVGLLKILTDHIGRMEDEIQEEVAKKSPQSEVPGWEYYQGDLS